jgi:hypothetical protein
MTHPFTEIIHEILAKRFGELGNLVFDNSPLLQYLNVKTRSANRGSKSRGSFANHYALYVLIEDYVSKGFLSTQSGRYHSYEGARFTDLFRRQRELPFGAKLQNHALNSRLNDEFAKYFPTLEIRKPIIRDLREQRYWINEQLLLIPVADSNENTTINIAEAIIEIIDTYIKTKRSAFEDFLDACKQIVELPEASTSDAHAFVKQLLQPNVDARIFEIISFAILKSYYGGSSIFWGFAENNLRQDYLTLYKTGRTNANDGGIDFVMKPLGRFFQVTETIDVNKYFLDIDKIQRFPLTFVIKTNDSEDIVLNQLNEQAKRKYGIDAIVARYMEAVEQIINIPILISMFETLVETGHLKEIMNEIVLQSRVEFNYEEDEDTGT